MRRRRRLFYQFLEVGGAKPNHDEIRWCEPDCISGPKLSDLIDPSSLILRRR
jgi:hypothetical protein